MHITPEEFFRVLNQTSLSVEDKRAIIDLLKNLTLEQINQLYGILLEDSKNVRKIMAKMESENQQLLFKLKNEIDEIKIAENNQSER